MRKRWIAAVGLVALIGMACGTGDGNQAGADSSRKQDAQEAALAYAECMREHGIDMPDPEVDDNGMISMEMGGEGADLGSDEMAEAQEACQDLLPEMEEPSEEEKAAIEDAMLEFAKCMRENGVDMPDPSDNGGGGVTIGGDEKGVESVVDFEDPEFQAAQEACKDLLPNMGGH